MVSDVGVVGLPFGDGFPVVGGCVACGDFLVLAVDVS